MTRSEETESRWWFSEMEVALNLEVWDVRDRSVRL